MPLVKKKSKPEAYRAKRYTGPPFNIDTFTRPSRESQIRLAELGTPYKPPETPDLEQESSDTILLDAHQKETVIETTDYPKEELPSFDADPAGPPFSSFLGLISQHSVARQYLEKYHIDDLIECLLAGLMMDCPVDELDYLDKKLDRIQQDQSLQSEGERVIKFDALISLHHPTRRLTRTRYVKTILHQDEHWKIKSHRSICKTDGDEELKPMFSVLVESEEDRWQAVARERQDFIESATEAGLLPIESQESTGAGGTSVTVKESSPRFTCAVARPSASFADESHEEHDLPDNLSNISFDIIY